ncbi:methyl jasmonate esterase 1 [Daucus carota subsp. sativus]|uniref:methyl jasmonate esterase 1 n=1 Tax=Daucus carota subsp. sativus TaxID=79200 RepID=UPI0007B1C589|nr:PREDICTED: methylesterase 3-like [Daucus carota subsp. sativus]
MASHFVLVHGACHGSWCWYKVATLLKSAGHTVTAVDLGGAGINPKQRHQLTTLADQLEPLMELMAALQPEEKVILVGHSMGGIAVSIAAEKFTKNVAAAVFVAAFMPNPDFNLHQFYRQLFNSQPDSNDKQVTEAGVLNFQDSRFTFEEREDSSSFLFRPNILRSTLYQLSPPEDLTLASSLVRPMPIFRDHASLKAAELTNKGYGSIRRVYIVSQGDLIIPEKIQREIILDYPPQDVKEISDSDHMVMFSKPQELDSLLQVVSEEM